MKFEWNRTIQTTVLAVIIVAVVPIAYIALFSAGVVNHVSSSQKSVHITGYVSQEECEDANEGKCEMVTTQSSDQYWVVAQQ